MGKGGVARSSAACNSSSSRIFREPCGRRPDRYATCGSDQRRPQHARSRSNAPHIWCNSIFTKYFSSSLREQPRPGAILRNGHRPFETHARQRAGHLSPRPLRLLDGRACRRRAENQCAGRTARVWLKPACSTCRSMRIPLHALSAGMRLDPILEAWWNGAFFDGIVLQALSEMAATHGWWPTGESELLLNLVWVPDRCFNTPGQSAFDAAVHLYALELDDVCYCVNWGVRVDSGAPLLGSVFCSLQTDAGKGALGSVCVPLTSSLPLAAFAPPSDPSLSFEESRNNIQQALVTAVGGNPEEPTTFTLSSAYIAALSAGREVIAAVRGGCAGRSMQERNMMRVESMLGLYGGREGWHNALQVGKK